MQTIKPYKKPKVSNKNLARSDASLDKSYEEIY